MYRIDNSANQIDLISWKGRAQAQCHFEAKNGKINKRQQNANTFLRYLAKL